MAQEITVDAEGREAFAIRKDSPFVKTEVLKTEDSDDYHFDIWEPPFDYKPQTGDLVHTITAADEQRLDLVAQQYYGNVRLWWILAFVNKIMHPWNEVTAGTRLIIPPLSWVQNYQVNL